MTQSVHLDPSNGRHPGRTLSRRHTILMPRSCDVDFSEDLTFPEYFFPVMESAWLAHMDYNT